MVVPQEIVYSEDSVMVWAYFGVEKVVYGFVSFASVLSGSVKGKRPPSVGKYCFSATSLFKGRWDNSTSMELSTSEEEV
jgi:hypothetical protein